MEIDRTNNIKKAATLLKAGRVVAFPTGTSYGLAADALQGHALQRLRNLKKRPAEKSFTVFMPESVYDQYLELTPAERDFLAKNKNQAFTLLVQSKESLAHLAQDGLIGLRVIDHPLMKSLAEDYASPLTATSANISGQDPCFSPACLQQQFPGKLNETTYDLSLGLTLDAGKLPKKPPSRIVQLVNGEIKIIRP